MAVKPLIKTLTNTSVDVLNAIRNGASINYKNYVPVATSNADSIKKIGAVIMDYPALQNEFIEALVNRIGLVITKSKMYSNPLAVFKRGIMELGESIEEIFVELAKPFQYDPAVAESTIYKREKPDVRSAFHVCNYKKFYKTTIERQNLGQAFTSIEGVTDLISKIIQSLWTAANYDEYQVTKYLIALALLDGRMTGVSVDDSELSTNLVKAIKKTSDDMIFMNANFNEAGVRTHVDKADQYVLMSTSVNADVDVDVLAKAFNMDKVSFAGHSLLVDGFGNLDTERLGELFEDDPTYVEIDSDDLAALADIYAVLVDRDWFVIYDNLVEMNEDKNGEGLYWNYRLHIWKTLSTSPFASNAAFGDEDGFAISSVAVTPDTVTSAPGATVYLKAAVTSQFGKKSVNWTSDTAGVTVTKYGAVSIPSDILDDAETDVEITIMAKSTADSTKYDTCTITVPVPESDDLGA